MPITIRKIELFCSLLFFSPTSLQRAKNACFSLIFPEKSAFRNGFELRRSDVKKDFFFNIFRRRSVGRIIFRQLPLFSDKYRQFRYIPKNSKVCIRQVTLSAGNPITAGFIGCRVPNFSSLSCIEISHFSKRCARRCDKN